MQIGFLIGRIIYGIYLLYSGIYGLAQSATMAGFAASKGVPAAGLAVLASMRRPAYRISPRVGL